MEAQRLSHLFRLALFGSNHGEIDLNGAFYELVRRFHLQLPASHPQLMSIHELRQHLQAFYQQKGFPVGLSFRGFLLAFVDLFVVVGLAKVP